jgi:RNA polymerase sigma factor (TIGR02999 family)
MAVNLWFASSTLGNMSDVTRLLDAAAAGDAQAAGELLPLVYEELRKLAAARMAAQAPGHTLDATALVHEAYLRLVGEQRFDNRGHFFAAAAEAMRRILVNHARDRSRQKRGGDWKRVQLDDVPAPSADDRLVALDDALTRLAAEDPDLAKVVELRHFGGLGHEHIAKLLDISVYEARQRWTFARAWLHDALSR